MPDFPSGCRFAGRLGPNANPSPASQPLASAMRAAARPLLAHAETGLRSLPGALCVTTVATGSHPEPSVLVVLSSPDVVAGAGVPKLFWSVNDG